MSTKNELKYYASLHRKKYRDDEKKFIVEGTKIIDEGLVSNFNCEIIFVTFQFNEENRKYLYELKKKGLTIEVLKSPEFKKISDTVTPQGIAAIFTKPSNKHTFISNQGSNIIVCLDNISDPGNIGTILRNCDWFGINNILMLNNSADAFSSKAIRASMGSIFHLNIKTEPDAKRSLSDIKIKGYKIICGDLKGKNIFQYQPDIKTAIIFSNEANGPSIDVLSLVDDSVTIPKLGTAESLNVASASAVILGQLTR